MHYRILSYLIIVFVAIGCSPQLSFDELTKDLPSKLGTRSYSSTKMGYSISLLDQFVLRDNNYNDTLKLELFIDTSMVFEEGASTLTIIKFNSTETTLEKSWRKFISDRMLIEDFQVYSEGLTDYLLEPAYYEHSAYTMSKKNTESINFLIRGDSSSFYFMNLEVIMEDDYPNNLKELLSCVKTVKLLP